ncbi:hypothetical protein JC2156_04190 [Weissella koreensis KCTC 3621]|uniref:pyocin knob domain-containing protein n=1 Tax=Weissella koreensis TaxID=165096 RepID=UPI00026F3640|nr:pyocin knob domain-containing protein [Weissella koreensis]EJF33709.1 hypothetical protein JC2156_05230 [Weissella koreensis KCTC 3621]EJF34111.1 hypothetical protein JC2156_04190 [Weissella koreensis KCTC 3621]
MAESYNKWYITQMQMNAQQAATNAKNQIIFKRIIASSDVYKQSDLQTLTNSAIGTIKVNQSALVGMIKIDQNTITVAANFTNSGLKDAYQMNTLYLIAEYNGSEYLAAATTAVNPWYMSEEKPDERVEYTFKVKIVISNTAIVNTTIDPNVEVLHEEFDDYKKHQDERDVGQDGKITALEEADKNNVKITGEQSIDGPKTFIQKILGNISGTAGAAIKLLTGRNITTNLASTSAAKFDGTVDITPGVSGILPVSNGGTGTNNGKTPSASSADKLSQGRKVQVDLASNNPINFDGTEDAYPGVFGVLTPFNGGTGNTTGNAPSASKLNPGRYIRTDLSSTNTAIFDGTANVTPGVTGVLPIANGGTGRSDGLADPLGRSISSNSDLNTIVKLGFYHASQNATVATFKNSPTKYAFSMVVERNGADDDGTPTKSGYGTKQTLSVYNSSDTYTRYNTGGTWSRWVKVLFDFPRAMSGNFSDIKSILTDIPKWSGRWSASNMAIANKPTGFGNYWVLEVIPGYNAQNGVLVAHDYQLGKHSLATVNNGILSSWTSIGDDTNTVHKNGNETIKGVKSFENNLHMINHQAIYFDALEADKMNTLMYATHPTKSGSPVLQVMYDSFGHMLGLGAGGTTMVGGGESVLTYMNLLNAGGARPAALKDVGPSNEQLLLASDGSVIIHSGYNAGGTTGATWQFDSSGNLQQWYSGKWVSRISSNGNMLGNLDGNASSATKLATARTIGGVSFNGTANINLPGVNVAGNQSTTGNAATATKAVSADKLTTARKINGVAFNGTSDISITDPNAVHKNAALSMKEYSVNFFGATNALQFHVTDTGVGVTVAGTLHMAPSNGGEKAGVQIPAGVPLPPYDIRIPWTSWAGIGGVTLRSGFHGFFLLKKDSRDIYYKQLSLRENDDKDYTISAGVDTSGFYPTH